MISESDERNNLYFAMFKCVSQSPSCSKLTAFRGATFVFAISKLFMVVISL